MKTFGKIQVTVASVLACLALWGCNQQTDNTAIATNSPPTVNSAPAVAPDTSAINSTTTNPALAADTASTTNSPATNAAPLVPPTN